LSLPDIWFYLFNALVGFTTAAGALFLFSKIGPQRANTVLPNHWQAKPPVPGMAAPPNDQENALNLQTILDRAPVLAWRIARDDSVIWSNSAYRKSLITCGIGDGKLGSLLDIDFEASSQAKNPSQRMHVVNPDTGETHWFETFIHPLDNAETLCFAILANPVVKAEQALRNFVQTLTKTFAHLPVGLAVFDRNRQLALFNPALSDLTTLEADWLTQRPSLMEFLDRLRDKQQVPEPKDYASWRNRILALEKGAEDGTYEENWALPSGRVYKVTGRPHPEGAVAFLIEDISASVMLKRQFRGELELEQSIIDHLPDALIVFSQSGEAVLSNDAFSQLWGFDPAANLTHMKQEDVAKQIGRQCGKSLVLRNLQNAMQIRRLRKDWQAKMVLRNGEHISARFSPLAGGSSLWAFYRDADRSDRESSGQPHIKPENVALKVS